MNVSIRLLAVTHLAQAMRLLENDGTGNSVLPIRSCILDLVQRIYDHVETQEEREEIVKSATQAIKSAGWTKYKFSVVNDRFYIIPDKDFWG